MTTTRYTAADSSVIDTATDEVLVEFDPRLRGEAKATELAATLNLELGDVITDSYGNPAVVVKFTNVGTRFHHASIMQLWGSDRGRITSAPSLIQVITDEARIAEARAVARTQSRLQGLKWNANGIV